MGLRLNDGSGNHVELTAPSLTSDVSLTLPNSIGTAGQFLQVQANGVTTWATALTLILQTDASVTDVKVGGASTCTNPVVLSGTTPYSYAYQWQFAVSGSSTFNDISGATSQSYTVPTLIGGVDPTNGQLRCVVTVTDSSTPALTITSTSNAVTIAAAFAQGTAGRAYQYSGSAWQAVTVNGSTTVDIRNQSRHGGGHNRHFVVTDANEVWTESSAASFNYDTNVTSSFGTAASIASGIRNIATCNNPDIVAAHYVLNNDIGHSNYGSGTWSLMSSVWPNAECLWLANMGWCANNALALINDNGTERLINVWASTYFTSTSYSAYQDMGVSLPNNEKVSQIISSGLDGGAYTDAMIILSDAGTLYQVGSNQNYISGGASGTFSSPTVFNPTGMVPIAEIKSTGGYTSTNGPGFLAKGTDGHLYGVTGGHAWAKILDDVATPGIVNGYGSNVIVPMQDGSFRWLTSASLGSARPYSWATVAAPSGLTVDTSGWTVWPTHNPGQCAPGYNGSMILAIPYS